ncbi:serine hydrolase [Calothrix sp. 336/3]|uniref:serine hydrolase n=1 Tax=Calothrix sp. 336/3 TaxID=1337936 RepID=UPI0004E33DAE|nr:serine hydrolase [Calothrix sp. 336/3]AKG21678.1 penicillin-binding protein [Calothrix sp. 336/3]
MSDSSYKLTGLSRRQPISRPVRRPVRKQGKPVAKVTGNKSAPPKEGKLVRMGEGSGVTPAKPGIRKSSKVIPIPLRANTPGRIPPFKPNYVKSRAVRVRKQAVSRKYTNSNRTKLKPMARAILYGLRLLIVGVGIGAIVGTMLSVLDPATRLTSTNTSETTSAQPTPTANATTAGLNLSQENIALKTAVQNLAASNPNLTPGVFLADLDSGSYVDLNGGAAFPAASTIKIPILVAFFQDVDQGKIRLDETLTMEKEMVATGSGDMQYKAVGSKFSALDVATKMMVISDNTATNMLIARMGGVETLNQRFRSWGLNTTNIRNILPDLEGTNTTSPKELGNLLGMVSKGNLLSMTSRDRLLYIMRRTVRDNLLPAGLGQGAIIAHKTGDIGNMLGDAGLVDLPTGKRYIAAVMVQRPRNDTSAEKMINSVSRVAYQQFSQTSPVQNNPVQNTPVQNNPVQNNPVQNNPIQNNLPQNTSIAPTTTYQPPVFNPNIPNTMPNGMGTNTYQPPVINPVIPNGVVTAPGMGYQTPVTNPQYYYPYQR